MDVFSSLSGDLSSGGIFNGFTLKQIVVLFAAMSRHDLMRHDPSGRATSKTQLRMLERNFMTSHNLSPEQYDRLLHLYRQADMEDVYDDVIRGAEHGGGGGDTPYVPEFFQSGTGGSCCGYTMTVREVQATAFSRSGAFPTKHVVKTCRGQCGRTWYLNKKTYKEKFGDDDVTTHTFY